jgi:hypothetical protein
MCRASTVRRDWVLPPKAPIPDSQNSRDPVGDGGESKDHGRHAVGWRSSGHAADRAVVGTGTPQIDDLASRFVATPAPVLSPGSARPWWPGCRGQIDCVDWLLAPLLPHERPPGRS